MIVWKRAWHLWNALWLLTSSRCVWKQFVTSLRLYFVERSCCFCSAWLAGGPDWPDAPRNSLLMTLWNEYVILHLNTSSEIVPVVAGGLGSFNFKLPGKVGVINSQPVSSIGPQLIPRDAQPSGSFHCSFRIFTDGLSFASSSDPRRLSCKFPPFCPFSLIVLLHLLFSGHCHFQHDNLFWYFWHQNNIRSEGGPRNSELFP